VSVFFWLSTNLKVSKHVAERIRVAGVEGSERVVQDAGVFAGEAFADELSSFGRFRSNILAMRPSAKIFFALVLGRAADGFDREAGDRDAEVMIIFLPFFFGSTWSES